jgi:hypothetical protein
MSPDVWPGIITVPAPVGTAAADPGGYGCGRGLDRRLARW